MAARSKPNELFLERIYDAPVKAVWDAWTDPKQAAQWWGPRGFTITTHSKELKPGGQWRYTMHGPDGTDYPNIATYFEVEKHAKLVYDHGATEKTPALFKVTVLFSEEKGKTKMSMTMALKTAEHAAEMAKFIKQANGNSTWDRLAEYLEKEATGKEKFVIARSFHTDIETMYDMWTSPKHVARWMGPTGSTMEFIRADIRPGGSAFYVMKFGAMTMYGRTEYVEMHRPDLIQYRQQFCDKDEKISRHPGAPTWPETMLTTIKLVQEDDEHTRVTITWEVHGKASAEEMAAFIKERGGMTQGWTGSFDKLEEYLEKK